MSTPMLTRRRTRSHSHTPLHVDVSQAAKPKSAARLNQARLQGIEDAVLARALENHPHRDAALDRCLEETEAPAATRAAGSRPLLLRSTRDMQRIEDLLLEAVIRTHPNRGKAMDRLLDDVAADDASVDLADVDQESAERARFDMNIDSDFDGLG